MEAKTTHILKDGWQFDHLFPKAIFTEVTVKKNALVEHTVKFIPLVVAKTKWQVERFVQQELQHLTLPAACEKLWHFVKDHIAYKKDKPGVEQIRSPRRLWWERVGDCDCYTTFISTCLSVMKSSKKVLLRITKYGGVSFQHIYPVVITPEGKEIIMDCVVENYNYEEPYTEKKDTPMELNYLDGVPEKNGANNLDSEMLENESDLGKLFNFLKKNKTATTTEAEPKKGGKLKQILKKGLNVINKINPATVALRAGILASMKLNVLKIAQRLKYAYLTDDQAKKRGVDMAKFQKLKAVREKIDKIFYGAGGKPENLKEAILKGNGNKNKEVPLSGFSSGYDIAVTGMNQNTPLTQVLGQEVYYSEFMEGSQEVNGLGQLGEPITAAAIAAASGVIGAIGALLKKIGNIFTKKDKAAADFETTAAEDLEVQQINTSEEKKDLDVLTRELEAENVNTTDNATNTSDTADDSTASSGDAKPKSGDGTDETFWQKNKSWLQPTLITVGSVATLGTLYFLLKPKPEKAKKTEKEPTLSGLKSTKNKPKNKPAPPKKKSKKKAGNKIKTIELN